MFAAIPAERRITAARAAVLAIFFLHGSLFATWASRIPAVKIAIGLSSAQLGMSLLGIALGCLLSMPLTGRLISRYGSGPVAAGASVFFSLAIVLPGFAVSQWTLTAALCVLGCGAGAMDVAMNAHAVAVERAAGRHMMSSFHAFFSIGGMAGAGLGGVVAGAGMAPRSHFIATSIAALLVTVIATLGLLPGSADADSDGRVRLRLSSRLVALGLIAFCFFLAEGAIADWSALYLHNTAGAPIGRSAYGYALFSLAMAIGRLSGDRLRSHFPAAALVRTGSLTAAFGLALALALPHTAPALLGFAIVGAGCSIVVPIAFAAAGSLEDSSPGAALAFATTTGYLGLFAGPPSIGFVAEEFTLRVALILVVCIAAAGAVLAPAARASGSVITDRPVVRCP